MSKTFYQTTKNEKHTIKNKIKVFKTKDKLTISATYKNKMKTYCVKCRKNTENIDPKIVRIKNNRLVMQSKCSVCGIKKSN